MKQGTDETHFSLFSLLLFLLKEFSPSSKFFLDQTCWFPNVSKSVTTMVTGLSWDNQLGWIERNCDQSQTWSIQSTSFYFPFHSIQTREREREWGREGERKKKEKWSKRKRERELKIVPKITLINFDTL